MKIFSLPFFLIGAVVILVGGGLVFVMADSHHVPPARIAVADSEPAADQASTANEASTSGDASGSPSTQPGPDQRQRGQHMQQMFAQLGLSDQQKQQIEQIRQTVTDRRQRREEIMKVLTPEQLAKWQQLRQERRNQSNPNSGTAPSSGAPPASGTSASAT